MMRTIKVKTIMQLVKNLSLRANTVLRKDILKALEKAYAKETNKRAKEILGAIIKNAFLRHVKPLVLHIYHWRKAINIVLDTTIYSLHSSVPSTP